MLDTVDAMLGEFVRDPVDDRERRPPRRDAEGRPVSTERAGP